MVTATQIEDFNPHHREGGDEANRPVYSNKKISIHTTAKVVTKAVMQLSTDTGISIHTTAKVVTAAARFMIPSTPISIHTTAKVVTL